MHLKIRWNGGDVHLEPVTGIPAEDLADWELELVPLLAALAGAQMVGRYRGLGLSELVRALRVVSVSGGAIYTQPVLPDGALIYIGKAKRRTFINFAIAYNDNHELTYAFDGVDLHVVRRGPFSVNERGLLPDRKPVPQPRGGAWMVDKDDARFITGWQPRFDAVGLVRPDGLPAPTAIGLVRGAAGWGVDPSQGLAVHFDGLGLPRSLISLIRVRAECGLSDCSNLRIIEDSGQLDLSGLTLTPPLDPVITIHLSSVYPFPDDHGPQSRAMQVALRTSFHSVFAQVAGHSTGELRGRVEVEALVFEGSGPAPRLLTVGVQAPEGDRELSCELKHWDVGERAVYVCREGLDLARADRPPALLRLSTPTQGIVGELLTLPSNASGRWEARDNGDGLRFVGTAPGRRPLTLFRPEPGGEGTRWAQGATPRYDESGIWRAGLPLPAPRSGTVYVPIRPEAAPELFRAEPGLGNPGATGAIELQSMHRGVTSARLWFPNSQPVELRPASPDGHSVRVAHSPGHDFMLSRSSMRLWGQSPAGATYGRLHELRFLDPGAWRRCPVAGGRHRISLSDLHFIDFRGLTSQARAVEVLDTTDQPSLIALLLDEPWPVDGRGRPGPDGAGLAPVQGATSWPSADGAAHYWIQTEQEGAALEHNVARREAGAQWVLRPGAAPDGGPPVRLRAPFVLGQGDEPPYLADAHVGVPDGAAWILARDGYLYELAAPGSVGVRFCGWLWPKTSPYLWTPAAPFSPYGFDVGPDDSAQPSWVASLRGGRILGWDQEPPPAIAQASALQEVLAGLGTIGPTTFEVEGSILRVQVVGQRGRAVLVQVEMRGGVTEAGPAELRVWSMPRTEVPHE